jgi:hypothetical protein
MAKEQTTYRAANDAYTGMLIISLLALITGGALLFLDFSQYPDANPKPPTKSAPPLEFKAPEKQQPEVKEEPKTDEKTDEEKDMKKDDEK